MLARLFAAHGFAEQLTTEPNIRMEPANILLVRFGEQVDSRAIAHFYNNLVK